jgi:branched-chain amino acid transport system permease protein
MAPAMHRPNPLRGALPGIAMTLIVAVLAAAMPWLGLSSYGRTLVYYAAYYLALGQAWNLMSGFTGYVSFAHGALAGIGAYAAVIAVNAELPIPVAMAVALGVALAASLVIGATSLRLKGVAFTFATLFFQALALLILRKLPFAGGPGGLVLQEILPVWLPHVMMMAVAACGTIAVILLRRSRLGIRVLAIKNDELAASAVGIDATRLKLVVFAVSAVLAGLTGATHALFAASLYPDVVFAVDTSIVALAIPLIGGVATAAGPVVGAVLYVGIREVLQVVAPGLHLTIVGLLLLAVILFMRDGVAPTLARVAARRFGTAAWLPAKAGS